MNKRQRKKTRTRWYNNEIRALKEWTRLMTPSRFAGYYRFLHHPRRRWHTVAAFRERNREIIAATARERAKIRAHREKGKRGD